MEKMEGETRALETVNLMAVAGALLIWVNWIGEMI